MVIFELLGYYSFNIQEVSINGHIYGHKGQYQSTTNIGSSWTFLRYSFMSFFKFEVCQLYLTS